MLSRRLALALALNALVPDESTKLRAQERSTMPVAPTTPGIDLAPLVRVTWLTDQYRGRRVIVFVHGIGGDDTKTWTNPTTQFSLAQAVASDPAFQDASVATVYYESSKGDRAGSLVRIAGAVNYALWHRGVLNPQMRPTAFVAHSMGGLVTKRVVAQLAVGINARMGLLGRVTTLVFLGTPHAGAHLGTWLNLAGGFQDLAADEVNRLLVEYEYQWTMALVDSDSSGHRSPHIACAIEGRPTRVPYTRGIIRAQVVDSTSATATICSADAIERFADRDHFELPTPASTQDTVYRWVRAALLETRPRVLTCQGAGPPRIRLQRDASDHGKPPECWRTYDQVQAMGFTPWARPRTP